MVRRFPGGTVMRSPGKLLRAVLLGMSWVAANAVRAEPPRFTPVAPGIDYAIFDQRPEDIEPARIHAFKIDLEVAEVRLVSAGGPASPIPSARFVHGP